MTGGLAALGARELPTPTLSVTELTRLGDEQSWNVQYNQ